MEWLIVWSICTIVGAIIGEVRGNMINGMLLGLLLGPLGLLIAALLPRSPKKQAQYERRVREAAERLP